ncbi:hypothetical protein BJX96DRAFT_147152 [Aspergillus floccosus]
MTRKLKKKPHLIQLDSPLKGKEIQELLGHVISNPYSPTDYIISDAHHPYLDYLQNEIERDLRCSLRERTKCTKCKISPDIEKKIQGALERGLRGPDPKVSNMPKFLNLDSLMHLKLHEYQKECVRSLQGQIVHVHKEIRKRRFQHDFLKDIWLPFHQHIILNKLQDVIIGVQNTISRLDCAFNQNFLQSCTPAVKQSLPNHADIDEEIEMLRHETKATLQQIKTSSISKPEEFNTITRLNSEHIAQHLQGVYRRCIQSAIMTAAKVHESERLAAAILELHTYLEERLDELFEEKGFGYFADGVMSELDRVSDRADLLKEMDELSNVIPDDQWTQILQCEKHGEVNGAQDIKQSFRDKLQLKRGNLIDEYQRTVAAEVVNEDEHYLTTSQRDRLERHRNGARVIVRKVRRHPKIFDCLNDKPGSYHAELRRLLKNHGRAYLVTSTYSYLEVGEETRPFQSPAGLNICGKPDGNTSLYVNTELPTGSVQFDFERFVVLDEKLFALEILKISPGLIGEIHHWLTKAGERLYKQRVVTPS